MPVGKSVNLCFTINVVLIAVRFLFTAMTTIVAAAAAVIIYLCICGL
jgi:hypothetical protein